MDIVLRESERLNGRSAVPGIRAAAALQRHAPRRPAVLNDTALLLRNSADVQQHHVIDVDVPADPVWCEADEGQVRQISGTWRPTGCGRCPTAAGCASARGAGPATTASRARSAGRGRRASRRRTRPIFQPFHGAFGRAPGLGMAIVHRIVSDYGGEIR